VTLPIIFLIDPNSLGCDKRSLVNKNSINCASYFRKKNLFIILLNQTLFWIICILYFKNLINSLPSMNNHYKILFHVLIRNYNNVFTFDIVGIIMEHVFLTFVMYNFLLPRIKYDIFNNYVISICYSFLTESF